MPLPEHSSIISARILRFLRASFPNLHQFPPQSFFFFFNPAASTNSPFPSLCVHPRADGPAWLGRFSEAPSLYPLDHLFGCPRPRRKNGRPEGRHRRVRSCSRATWAPAESVRRVNSALPLPARVPWERGRPGRLGRFPTRAVRGTFFVAFRCCWLRAVRMFLFCFVYAFWYVVEEKASVVNKVPISLNCLPDPSSGGGGGGGAAKERLPEASKKS